MQIMNLKKRFCRNCQNYLHMRINLNIISITRIAIIQR